jgi:hypothetical protein
MVYATNPKSSPTIIYYHENAGSKNIPKIDIGFRLPFIRELIRRTHSNVLLVAYRGYSDS